MIAHRAIFDLDIWLHLKTGEIIVQADADTVYPVDWLSRIARHFCSHPEAIAVAGDVRYIDSPTWAKPPQAFRRLINRLSFHLLGKTPFCLAATFAFRRQALQKVGGYNTSGSAYGVAVDAAGRVTTVNRQAENILGVHATTSLRDGLARTIEWFRTTQQ
jgi:cellulose synthase/poly-beta-1,6-N-acetylglucosamine synthase-like glycosyltransferase